VSVWDTGTYRNATERDGNEVLSGRTVEQVDDEERE
jgi:hypothetical protein